MKRFVTVASIVLLLAACQDTAGTEPSGEDTQAAEGEVLGGSISDAMLPLDTVTSQPPPVREASASPASEEASGDEPDDAGGEPEAEAEPAAADEPVGEADVEG